MSRLASEAEVAKAATAGLTMTPCFLTAAIAFVKQHHRHNKPPVGGLFAAAVRHGNVLVGVAIVGRPVARRFQDGVTCEITRCCVLPDAPKNVPSMLYGAAWRAARALGWQRMITYTLQSESGASLRGAGWELIAARKAGDPTAWLTRPDRALQEVVGEAKYLWEARP